MRIVRVFVVLLLVALVMQIGPASAGEIEVDVTFDEIGWDEAGDNCAAPSDRFSVPYGAPVELCFTFTARSGFESLSSFRLGETNGPLGNSIVNELWTQTAAGSSEETVSGSVAFTAGEQTEQNVYFRAEAESAFGPPFGDNAFARLSLESPPLVKTVSDDGTCGTATEFTVLENTEVTYCFQMTNPAAALELFVYELNDDHLGDLGRRGFTIGPGDTLEVLVSEVATETITNTVVSCAVFDEGEQVQIQAADAHEEACEAESEGAFATATVTAEAPNPGVDISVGVGTDATVCATAPEVDIAPGTEVFFCATATNTGNVTFDLHTISDTVNGALLTDGAHVLAPGESVTTLDLGITSSSTADATIVNTLSWTASGTVPDPPVAVTAAAVVSTTTESTATAQVVQPTPTPTPAPTPTTGPTPTPTPGVVDQIAFTGSETWPITIVGLTLVAAGLIVATGARRRED